MKKTSSLLSKMASRNSVTNWNFFCDMIKYVPPRINRLLRQKKYFHNYNIETGFILPHFVTKMVFLHTLWRVCCGSIRRVQIASAEKY
jgi:hypothetical protein